MRQLRCSAAAGALLACAISPVAQTYADAGPSTSTTDAGAPTPRAPGSFIYATHVANMAHVPAAAAAGFTNIVAFVPWSSVEPQRGTYLFEQETNGRLAPNDLTNVVDAAHNNGLKLILRLDSVPGWAGGSPSRVDPADVEDYVYHAAKYAGDTLTGVEVFNEMNLPSEWGASPDPAAYAAILKAAYQGAKRANPNVLVFSAGVSQRTGGLDGSMEDVDWLNGLYQAGAKGSFDALGVHAYLGNVDPSADPTSCSPMCFRDVELYRAVMDHYGDDGTPVYVSEMGTLEQAPMSLGDYQWMTLPPDQRATNLVNALKLATTYPWLMGASVFNLDYAEVPWVSPSSEESWFSLFSANGQPRQAYTQIRTARTDHELP